MWEAWKLSLTTCGKSDSNRVQNQLHWLSDDSDLATSTLGAFVMFCLITITQLGDVSTDHEQKNIY